VAGRSLQDAYVGLLMDRVRQERFPNPEHLDRIEEALATPQQLREYVQLLFEKVEGTRYPSAAMLNRVRAFAALEQQARARARRR
jgi:hypothetical protein